MAALSRVAVQPHRTERTRTPAIAGTGEYRPRPAPGMGRVVSDGRTVCRNEARPTGWIAVAVAVAVVYVAADGGCPRVSGDSLPTAVVLT